MSNTSFKTRRFADSTQSARDNFSIVTLMNCFGSIDKAEAFFREARKVVCEKCGNSSNWFCESNGDGVCVCVFSDNAINEEVSSLATKAACCAIAA